MFQPDHLFAGRYRIVRHIADGGMGAIFEAEHVATEARVALKLLLPHVVQMPSARRRFELEAKVAARVNSEHIVKVLDAGLDDVTRSPFLVMELLVGRTLAAHVQRSGPLPPGKALALMRQVASGLDAAHGYCTPDGMAQPIVHRDLKPENLFLALRDDGSIRVKILDFGIAKVLSATTEVSQEMRGTPLYMAFEQAAGEALSAQTDIWAFGLITYFALTARRYWPSANKATGSTQALFAEILTLPLPLPSRRLREDGSPIVLPPAFDAWLLRCIDRNPARRFASAGQAVDALERALEGTEELQARAREGRHPRSSAAVTVEFPMASSAGIQSASVAGVASERHSTSLRGAGHRIALASFAAAALSIGVLGAAWQWSRAGSLAGAAAPEPASAGTIDTRPAAHAEAASHELAGASREPAADEPTSALEPAQQSPRVSVQALEPATAKDGRRAQSTRAPRGATRPLVARNPIEKPKPRTPSEASRPDAPSAPPRSPKTPAPAEQPTDPARSPAKESSCTSFDPYTGRCTDKSP